VKRPGPRNCHAEPKTPWGLPAAKVARGAGNARGAGARRSFGWQTSVGRIERLLHREVARPVGEHERALARRKSVAPPDAGRGWRDGETVRVTSKDKSVCRCSWPAGESLQVCDTTKGVLGLVPVGPSPAPAKQSPSVRRFNSTSLAARSVKLDSASGGYGIRLGRASE
jgi:hypothetical protein